jgi:hypothetical protein
VSVLVDEELVLVAEADDELLCRTGAFVLVPWLLSTDGLLKVRPAK